MRTPTPAVICAALLLLTGCGGADEPVVDQPIEDAPDDEVPVEDPGDEGAADEDTTDDPAGDEMIDPPEDESEGASDPLLGPELEVALDDASERSGVPRDELSVTLTELVTWPDGAAGCPEPDTMYTQALVDGFRIVVEADGETYEYVGAEGGQPGYCENPQDPVGGPT